MHTAENDIFGFGISCLARQLQRVAGIISMFEHFIALIMMTEDNDTISQRLLGCENALTTIFIVESSIRLKF